MRFPGVFALGVCASENSVASVEAYLFARVPLQLLCLAKVVACTRTRLQESRQLRLQLLHRLRMAFLAPGVCRLKQLYGGLASSGPS